MSDKQHLESIARYVRSLIVRSTSTALSGHPTSCLSAVEIAASLFFDGFYESDIKNPNNINNDKFILSKGHAAPLLYSLYVVAGVLKEEELMQLRTFNSPLEGHPSPRFPFIDVASGSLGQGLSVAVGMSLATKRLEIDNTIFVLLGDGEMEEGANWEAMQMASFYKIHNLIGIVDVSQLEQDGETMLGENSAHGATTLQKRVEAFGWKTIVVDGHSFEELHNAFTEAKNTENHPVMILAITTKGKGVSFLEGARGWHGKVLNTEQLTSALFELGNPKVLTSYIMAPKNIAAVHSKRSISTNISILPEYKIGDMIATRKAYGTGLVKSIQRNNMILSLDAGLSNSTFAQTVKNIIPSAFYEMYIAEQNMIGVAVGLSKYGFVPFASSFGSFLSRAHDQLRMAQYSAANIKLIGSHVGVSMGQDGPSQMGLEDIAMFRSILDCVVLYPSDAVSTEALVNEAAEHQGMVYLRMTRIDTPVLYKPTDEFPIGGSKILKKTNSDKVVIFTAGITVHEGLKAHDELIKDGVSMCVVDVYSIKPLDEETIKNLALEYENVIVVEDHYPAGGLGEAIARVLVGLPIRFAHLAVNKIPRSGTSQELLHYEEISSSAIISAVNKFL